jgi:hypothetical protein
MNHTSTTASLPTIPAEVQAFAVEKGLSRYLRPVIGLVHKAFPLSAAYASLGQDAEDESHRYIAIDVDVGKLTAEELFAGQRMWSKGLGTICPSCNAVYFVLGWE